MKSRQKFITMFLHMNHLDGLSSLWIEQVDLFGNYIVVREIVSFSKKGINHLEQDKWCKT
jgi:hypothetical protein